jgi:hypothetical protein
MINELSLNKIRNVIKMSGISDLDYLNYDETWRVICHLNGEEFDR